MTTRSRLIRYSTCLWALAAVFVASPAGAVPISAFDELGSGNVQANSGWHEFDVVDGVNNTFIIHVQNISSDAPALGEVELYDGAELVPISSIAVSAGSWSCETQSNRWYTSAEAIAGQGRYGVGNLLDGSGGGSNNNSTTRSRQPYAFRSWGVRTEHPQQGP